MKRDKALFVFKIQIVGHDWDGGLLTKGNRSTPSSIKVRRDLGREKCKIIHGFTSGFEMVRDVKFNHQVHILALD